MPRMSLVERYFPRRASRSRSSSSSMPHASAASASVRVAASSDARCSCMRRLTLLVYETLSRPYAMLLHASPLTPRELDSQLRRQLSSGLTAACLQASQQHVFRPHSSMSSGLTAACLERLRLSTLRMSQLSPVVYVSRACASARCVSVSRRHQLMPCSIEGSRAPQLERA